MKSKEQERELQNLYYKSLEKFQTGKISIPLKIHMNPILNSNFSSNDYPIKFYLEMENSDLINFSLFAILVSIININSNEISYYIYKVKMMEVSEGKRACSKTITLPIQPGVFLICACAIINPFNNPYLYEGKTTNKSFIKINGSDGLIFLLKRDLGKTTFLKDIPVISNISKKEE